MSLFERHLSVSILFLPTSGNSPPKLTAYASALGKQQRSDFFPVTNKPTTVT